MPSLTLTTNIEIPNVKEFCLEFSKVLFTVPEKFLGFSEKYMSIQYMHNANLTFAGTFDPGALLAITSLESFSSSEKNEKYSAAFFKFFQEKLGIPSDRAYIIFYDAGRERLGYQGTIFSVILG
ncbi:hypothetical protein M422DRAFT_217691, partial [Sphaerobolus stellatus SS14]